jgi:hypothetical protein
MEQEAIRTGFSGAPVVTGMQVIPALYKQHGPGARDEAVAMQYLISGWTFDDKRPCLVR